MAPIPIILLIEEAGIMEGERSCLPVAEWDVCRKVRFSDRMRQDASRRDSIECKQLWLLYKDNTGAVLMRSVGGAR